MSGLEVVGLVCAIVSAFTGAAALVRKRKAKKQKRAVREAVERSLELGPPRVRGEYDHGFARLGPRFAKGDDIGSHELKDIVIQMQSQMITTLHSLLGSGTTEQYDDLLGISENSRIRAVSALVEQYQRISIALPLREMPREPPSSRSGTVMGSTPFALRGQGRGKPAKRRPEKSRRAPPSSLSRSRSRNRSRSTDSNSDDSLHNGISPAAGGSNRFVPTHRLYSKEKLELSKIQDPLPRSSLLAWMAGPSSKSKETSISEAADNDSTDGVLEWMAEPLSKNKGTSQFDAADNDSTNGVLAGMVEPPSKSEETSQLEAADNDSVHGILAWMAGPRLKNKGIGKSETANDDFVDGIMAPKTGPSPKNKKTRKSDVVDDGSVHGLLAWMVGPSQKGREEQQIKSRRR